MIFKNRLFTVVTVYDDAELTFVSLRKLSLKISATNHTATTTITTTKKQTNSNEDLSDTMMPGVTTRRSAVIEKPRDASL